MDEIFDPFAAKKMGIESKGQICVMVHSGSRGLGHQVIPITFIILVTLIKQYMRLKVLFDNPDDLDGPDNSVGSYGCVGGDGEGHEQRRHQNQR